MADIELAPLCALCWDLDDFTTFVTAEAFGEYAKRSLQQHLKRIKHNGKLDETIALEAEGNDALRMKGRVVACSCHARRMYSISMRGKRVSGKGISYWNQESFSKSNWSWDHQKSQKANLFQTQLLCDRIAEVLLRDDPQGLILILGATGSGKSTLARDLVDRHLVRCRDKAQKLQKRRPHLVTIEDPIESLFGNGTLDTISSTYGIDYTPRQVGEGYDAPDIAAALLDAKRQKPAVVFVGELRRERDWKALLEFAGSGHLVVATGHSGSLVEGMTNLLSVFKASSTPEQAFILSRVLALVHLRTYSDGEGNSYCIPTVWRQTAAGLATFVMDGLTSFLPHCPSSPCDAESLPSCLGRQWFAREIGANGVILRCIADDLQGI